VRGLREALIAKAGENTILQGYKPRQYGLTRGQVRLGRKRVRGAQPLKHLPALLGLITQLKHRRKTKKKSQKGVTGEAAGQSTMSSTGLKGKTKG